MLSESGNPTLPGATGTSIYENLIYDRFQCGLITMTVILSTMLLLISQIIVLDKSHLALKSFSQQLPPISKKASTRKIGKNDTTNLFDFPVKYDNSQGIQIQQRNGIFAKLSSCIDWIKRGVYELLANELGALSTSRILSICANIHVVYTMFVIVVWIYYAFTSGGQWLSFVLIYTALFASAIEVGFLEKSSLLVICNDIIADFDKNNRKAHIS
jgi:hypothetical protein